MLSQADLKREATRLAGTLSPNAKVGIQSQMRDFEQNLMPMQCSVHNTSNQKVGEKATTASISVYEACSAQVYDYSEVASLTRSAFLADAQSQAGSNFVERGVLTIATQKTTLLDGSHRTYELDISAAGTLIFHLSSSALQAIATQIAGKRLITAQRNLLGLAGVSGVYIKPVSSSDTTLPADPGQIQIEVMPVK
jgi:hypothetical protein